MTTSGLIIAILVFGLLIMIHELGHFLAAKACGVKVDEFAVGFGPRLVGFTRGETEYSLRLLPLGGYCRMAGMDETDEDDPRGFNNKPVLQRMAVILAGPIANFLLASVLYSGILYFVGTDRVEEPIVGTVQAVCDVTSSSGSIDTAPCPAYEAGLQAGDRILSINGNAVSDWYAIFDLVGDSQGQPLSFTIQRGDQQLEKTITPVLASDGRYIVGIRWPTRRQPLLSALAQGPVLTVQTLGDMLVGLGQMITGRIPAELTGPVGITKGIAQQAAVGAANLWIFVAYLSLNLGLFNLLPIPALDGARFVFLVVEAVRGRRVDPQRENMVHFVGFLLLLGLMVVVAYSDILRW